MNVYYLHASSAAPKECSASADQCRWRDLTLNNKACDHLPCWRLPGLHAVMLMVALPAGGGV